MSAPDWIRRQLERPLSAREQQLLFTATAILLVAATLLVAVTSVGVPSHSSVHVVKAPVARVHQTQPPQRQQALAVARRFLRGYLAFVYGQTPASAVADATAGFRAALAQRSRPAPPALRRLHPKIVSLKIGASTGAATVVDAMVKDGEVVAYPITIILVSRGGRLSAARVGES
jgi:hypothetical protein